MRLAWPFRSPGTTVPVTVCTACSPTRIELLLTAATTRSWRGSSASLAQPSMRPPVDADRIRALARALGEVAREETTLYLTGGSTAVIEGWRPSTVDVDLRLEPESDDLMRAIAAAKDELDINVELVSPPDFVPELPDWRERSPFVLREGRLTVRHFDLYSQALSKIERGFAQDLEDVEAMESRGLVDPRRARELFAAIEADLHRYPAIDPGGFQARVEAALGD